MGYRSGDLRDFDEKSFHEVGCTADRDRLLALAVLPGGSRRIAPRRNDHGGSGNHRQHHAGWHRASWHAIEEPIPYSNKPHPVFRLKSHGGSGWGAYPPAEDDAAWQQIDRSARWLGFDWNRVELEQRIYEPQRERFSWDNPEMGILYRILDWCEKNKADVFLQQMWGNVRWNTFPEWRDDLVGRVHSGPVSKEDFGEGLATLVEHMVKTKGYTCIRWVCINNEPNGKWSWWQQPPNQLMPLKPGLAAVRKALDAKGIRIPLSGPDLTGGVPPLEPQRFNFLNLLGAYDLHTYRENFDWLSQGQMARCDTITADWASWRTKITSRCSCRSSARRPTATMPVIPARAAMNRRSKRGISDPPDQRRGGRVQPLEFHQSW